MVWRHKDFREIDEFANTVVWTWSHFQSDAQPIREKLWGANEKASVHFENGPYYTSLLFDFLTIYLHHKFYRSSHKLIYQLQLKLGCVNWRLHYIMGLVTLRHGGPIETSNTAPWVGEILCFREIIWAWQSVDGDYALSIEYYSELVNHVSENLEVLVGRK